VRIGVGLNHPRKSSPRGVLSPFLVGVCSLRSRSAMRSMLIIEGSTIVARLFAEMFERRGWEVVVCDDRASAFDRLGGGALYDAILLSHTVPGTNGLQLIGLIRALEHLRTAAVVMITGAKEVKEDALAAGADAVLSKPVNPNALIWIVEKHTG